jgi:hypothetical protein
MAVWDATTNTCNVYGSTSTEPTIIPWNGGMWNGVTLQVDAGATLNLLNVGALFQNPADLINYGTINTYQLLADSGSTIYNYGTMMLCGFAAQLQNSAGGVVDINGLCNGFDNFGTITNHGTINVQSQGSITNYEGNRHGTSTINNYGIINIAAGGLIVNQEGMQYKTQQGIINNYGTINNAGTLLNRCRGVITGNAVIGNPVDQLDCTQTTVSPDSGTVKAGTRLTFTVTVEDTGPGTPKAPTGIVKFLPLKLKCTLAPISSASSQCTVNYLVPSNAQSISFRVHYIPDSIHESVNVKASLNVVQ